MFLPLVISPTPDNGRRQTKRRSKRLDKPLLHEDYNAQEAPSKLWCLDTKSYLAFLRPKTSLQFRMQAPTGFLRTENLSELPGARKWLAHGKRCSILLEAPLRYIYSGADTFNLTTDQYYRVDILMVFDLPFAHYFTSICFLNSESTLRRWAPKSSIVNKAFLFFSVVQQTSVNSIL